jgi:signal transduction histidine kinase
VVEDNCAAPKPLTSDGDFGDLAAIRGVVVCGDPRRVSSLSDAVRHASPAIKLTRYSNLADLIGAQPAFALASPDCPSFVVVDAFSDPVRAGICAAEIKAVLPTVVVLIVGDFDAVSQPSYIRQVFGLGVDDVLAGPPWCEPVLIHAFQRAAWQAAASTADLAVAEPSLPWGEPADRRLMAEVGHEMRAPLGSIIGVARSIAQEALGPIRESPDRYREYAQDICASGEHMLALFDQLLEIGSACADALEARLTVEPMAVVAGAAKLAKPLADAKNLTLAIGPAARDESNGDGDTLVLGSASLLQQAVYDLVQNAVKFSPPGETIGLEVSVGANVCIAIKDNGVGMDAPTLRRIRQAQRPPRDGLQRGLGLGLPFVQRVIAGHNGHFALDSTLNKGTTVRLYLPIAGRGRKLAEA